MKLMGKQNHAIGAMVSVGEKAAAGERGVAYPSLHRVFQPPRRSNFLSVKPIAFEVAANVIIIHHICTNEGEHQRKTGFNKIASLGNDYCNRFGRCQYLL